MPKAIIISDLHLEHGTKFVLEKIEGVDFLILAGDIGSYKSHLPFIKDCASKYKVLYVLGNHEFYGYTLKEVRDFWKSVELENFYFLDNSSVIIDGIKFIGSTLWTNFDNENPFVIMDAYSKITDYKKIIASDNSDFISPYDILEEFKESIDFIKKEIDITADFKKVVITHHAPSVESVNEKYLQNYHNLKNNYYYTSDLDNLILYSDISLWIHGHMHTSSDYILGDTRVICNPHGYPKEQKSDFEIKIIDI